jgi:hypothetical protein
MIMQEPLELERCDDAVSIPAQPPPQPTRLDMLEEGMSELKEQNEQLRDRVSRLERKWWRKAHEALCSLFEAILSFFLWRRYGILVPVSRPR